MNRLLNILVALAISLVVTTASAPSESRERQQLAFCCPDYPLPPCPPACPGDPPKDPPAAY